jgi:cytochrome P450
MQHTPRCDERCFPRSLALDPERDVPRRLPRHAYFPFGGGPLCIGNNSARMEAVLVLATIAQRWRPAIPAAVSRSPCVRVDHCGRP